MWRVVRVKIHLETGECRNDLLAMEHLQEKVRLDFDALVRLRFLGPALCNHGIFPNLLLTAAYCGYRE